LIDEYVLVFLTFSSIDLPEVSSHIATSSSFHFYATRQQEDLQQYVTVGVILLISALMELSAILARSLF
jgi:hypothetical protein